jgi:inner membrane protein
MDSITQIILGAAVGEAALGKKIGNRAMVWGAIAGTIPDLDVLANFFMLPIDALAFHRAISHSFVFSAIAAVCLGWLIHKMYQLSHHKKIGIASWSLLVVGIGSLIGLTGNISIVKISIALVVLISLLFLIFKRYTRSGYTTPIATSREWQWMFFWAFVTHPILDCHTTYGTQFFLPFSDYRVAFNNIAVADPAYTVPFMVCLLIAMSLPKASVNRIRWNYAGLIISSLYMLFTFYNKSRINTIFEQTLVLEQVNANRYMTTPTILNNILWSGVAETDSAYYYGQYSFFDIENTFKLNKIDKNRSLLGDAINTDPTIKKLRWFSNDYYIIKPSIGDSLMYYDVRYGTFKTSLSANEEFVFKFNLIEKPKGTYTLLDQGESPRDADFGQAFQMLWTRIKGI